MKTVIETPTFIREANKIWTEEQRLDFIEFISENPEAGDLIQESGGARKVRWAAAGGGKSGGVRVITWIQDEHSVTLLTVYRKSARGTIKPSQIRRIK